MIPDPSKSNHNKGWLVMQEIAKRPYHQKIIKRRKQETQTLTETVISPDFWKE